MTIPAGVRRPLNAFTFKTVLARRGLAVIETRHLMIGLRTSAGTVAAGVITEVKTEAEAAEFFGEGSDLALQLVWAMKGSRDYESGGSPEFWAIAQDDPAGTASTDTFTIAAGTATETSELVARIAGRTIRAVVNAGDDQDAAALSLRDAINALQRELMVTATASTNTVPCVNRHAAAIGGDLLFEAVSGVAGLGAFTVANAVAAAGALDFTASLDLAVDKDYDLITSSAHDSNWISDLAAHFATTWAPTEAQFRFGLTAETGTLATATGLATAADSERQLVATAEGFRNTEAEIAAYLAGFFLSEDNPSQPFQGRELPSLYLPDKDDNPTNAEKETALANGAFSLALNKRGTRAIVVSVVTTKTTENSQPFYELADWTIMRSAVFTTRQVDARIDLDFPQPKINARTKKAVRSTVLDVLKIEEQPPLEILKNVDARAGEVTVEDSSVVSNRLEINIPIDVVKPLRQNDITMSLIV